MKTITVMVVLMSAICVAQQNDFPVYDPPLPEPVEPARLLGDTPNVDLLVAPRSYRRIKGGDSHDIVIPPHFLSKSRAKYRYIDVDRPYRSSITVRLPAGMIEAINSPGYSFCQFWDFHCYMDRDDPGVPGIDNKRETTSSTPAARFMPDGDGNVRIEVRFHGSVNEWTTHHDFEHQNHVCIGGLSAKKFHSPERFKRSNGHIKGGKHWVHYEGGIKEGVPIKLTIEEMKNRTSGWGKLWVNDVFVWEYKDKPNCMPSPRHPDDSGCRYPYEGAYNRSKTHDSRIIIEDHTFEYLDEAGD